MAMYLGDKPVKVIMRGKNLLDLTKVTIRSTANMKITQYGNKLLFIGRLSAWQLIFDYKELPPLEDGKTYTISCNKYYAYGNVGVRMQLRIQNREDNTVASTNEGWSNAIKFIVDNTKYRYFVRIQGGPTAGVFNEILQWMINEGDSLPYEPYNQHFTAPIIKRIGNNLAKNEYADGQETVEAVAFLRTNGVSYFEVYRSGTQTKAAGRSVFKTKIKKAGIYTLTVSNIPFNRLEISRGTVYMVALNKGGVMRHTFTLPNDNTEISIVAVITTSDTIGTEEEPTRIEVMLNEGNTVLPYEPYREWYEY